MKELEFKGSVAATGQIEVPPQIAQQIPVGEQLRIVVSSGNPVEDDDWKASGRQRFEAAYAPEDSVYEHLMEETPTR